MNPNTVAIAAISTPGEVEEVHPFHTLFDLIALHGWHFILAQMSEVAHVRGDDAMATVLTVITEGMGDTQYDGTKPRTQGQTDSHDKRNRPWHTTTVKDCQRQRDILLELGADHDSIAVLAGINPDQCTQTGRRGHLRFPRRCYGCPANEPRSPDGTHIPMARRCVMGQTLTNRREQMAKPILIVTHKRFRDWWATERVPPERLVVVDEDLAQYEQFTFYAGEFNALAKIDAAAPCTIEGDTVEIHQYLF